MTLGSDPYVVLSDNNDPAGLRSELGDRTLVLATGCFDILHVGHVTFIHEAATQADVLLVGVNSDRAVRSLKGGNRPVVSEENRAAMVRSIRYVDAVFVYDDVVADDVIRAVRPHIFVTGEESFTAYPTEVEAARAIGARVHVISRVPGLSTTSMLERATLTKETG